MNLRVLVGVLSLLFSSHALANWTVNAGYQNPTYHKYGLNFLYWGQQWMFEIGVGWVSANLDTDDEDDEETSTNNSANNSDTDDDEETEAAVGGDIDIKYKFSNSGLIPYAQLGFGYAASGGESGAGAHAGGGFAGLGVFAGKPTGYIYLSLNATANSSSFLQAGLGIDI